MIEPAAEPEPFTAEVDQLDPDDLDQSEVIRSRYPAIPVALEGIARVRMLPSRRLALGNAPVPTGGEPARILPRNDRRQTAVLYADGGNVYLFTENPARSSTAGFLFVNGGALTLDYTGELFAVNNGGSLVTVSYALTLVDD